MSARCRGVRSSAPPALPTQSVSPPDSVVARSASSSTNAPSVMSPARATARRPRARTRSATASISLTRRAVNTTSQPASASATAIPSPMPRPAPVTTARPPSSANRSSTAMCPPRCRCCHRPVARASSRCDGHRYHYGRKHARRASPDRVRRRRRRTSRR